ncbi:AMP-binding protein [Legionella sp.]|uniref:AMP-binding protein n=1 Tax=Legionella sp. TaxID=459 RepID=UPI0032200F8E
MTEISQTLLSVIERNAQAYPDKIAYSFLNDMLQETSHCTYSQLIKRSKNFASYLVNKSAQGKTVLLMFNPGLDFIIAFFACLYAGSIPVPCYSARIVDKNLKRFLAIIEDSNASFLLTDDDLSASLSEQFRQRNISVLNCCEAEQNTNSSALSCGLPEDIAFLQYTSGSTADPKGVIVKYRNIFHNETLIQDSFQLDADSTIVGWLPFFHDMGLIGNIIQPIFCGGRAVLMAPTTFLRKPLNWLYIISKYKAVCSGGPNFSYDFCVERISDEEVKALDLSSWRVAFNGSEVVQAATLERFYNKFAPAGFVREAFLPCYGMAEATLFVSGCPRQERPLQASFDKQFLAMGQIVEQAGGRTLVSSGQLNNEFKIKIIDPASQVEVTGQIGEICIAGESVSDGYWRKAARENDYFKTGDLGFIHNNQLFIVGRAKELIIIRGKNYVPQDIEQLVQRNPALVPGAGACFSIEHEGEERLVIVQEVKRQYLKGLNTNELLQSIQEEVGSALGIVAHAIVLIRPLTLPKTSSGKIMRLRTKSLYLENQLQTIAQWQKQTPISRPTISIEELRANSKDLEKTLELLCKKIVDLEMDEQNKQQSLQTLGFDSVQIAELGSYLYEIYYCQIPAEQFYQHMTFNKLLGLLEDHNSREAPSPLCTQEEKIEIIL